MASQSDWRGAELIRRIRTSLFSIRCGSLRAIAVRALGGGSWKRSSPGRGYGMCPPLSANMSETVTPWKFSVEGEAGLESDERMGAGPRWVGDRGGGEGDAAAVHGGVQAEDRPGGRRL